MESLTFSRYRSVESEPSQDDWRTRMAQHPTFQDQLGEPVAGNGLLHRRFFLQTGAAIVGATATLATARAESIGSGSPATMLKPGAGFTGYGTPSHWRENV